MSKKGLGELEALTAGERLLIMRRRTSLTQRQAAERMGVSTARYSLWERDALEGAPLVEIGELKIHERCLLYRRRSKTTQEQVAQELGCCRWWLNQMERGDAPCHELVSYWEC